MAKTMKPGVGIEITQKALKESVEGIEAVEAEIRSDSASHAKRMGNKREKITKLREDAKAAGANGKVLNAVLEVRDFDRKRADVTKDFSEAEQTTFDSYLYMLGMLAEDGKDLRARFKQDEARVAAH